MTNNISLCRVKIWIFNIILLGNVGNFQHIQNVSAFHVMWLPSMKRSLALPLNLQCNIARYNPEQTGSWPEYQLTWAIIQPDDLFSVSNQITAQSLFTANVFSTVYITSGQCNSLLIWFECNRFGMMQINFTLRKLKKCWINKGDQSFFFNVKIIINVLVSYFRFIWIPMLWVYGRYICFNSFSAVTFIRRQKLQASGNDYLTPSSLNLQSSSSSTTSRELLSQFSTCSGWRWLDVV